MNVIFGRLVGNFTSFGTPGSSTTQVSLSALQPRPYIS